MSKPAMISMCVRLPEQTVQEMMRRAGINRPGTAARITIDRALGRAPADLERDAVASQAQ